jgi:hypothetical protein
MYVKACLLSPFLSDLNDAEILKINWMVVSRQELEIRKQLQKSKNRWPEMVQWPWYRRRVSSALRRGGGGSVRCTVREDFGNRGLCAEFVPRSLTGEIIVPWQWRSASLRVHLTSCQMTFCPAVTATLRGGGFENAEDRRTNINAESSAVPLDTFSDYFALI